jgi:hypothetical protein
MSLDRLHVFHGAAQAGRNDPGRGAFGNGPADVEQLHASCRGKLQAGQGKGNDHAKSQMAFGSGNDKSLKTVAD